MDNIFDLLQNQMTPEVIGALSKQIRADESTTASAAQGAISAIVGALSKNASSPEGAGGLLSALDRDHDGSVLNDIMGLVSGAGVSTSKSTNGLGILSHLLGGKTNNVISALSQGTNLNFMQIASLLTSLAPIVMGSLGKAKQENVVSQNNVFDFLNNSMKQAAPQRKELSFFEKLLDQDGDGNTMDDVAGMGMKLLGNFLNRK